MEQALNIIRDRGLTQEQKVAGLARLAESTIDILNIDEETQRYRDMGIMCDLFEGNAPYRPRYIVPDYEIFMKQGCEFLGLTPATNIWEATNNLLILYKHVPSITTMPVYLGNLDYLLEPYVGDEGEARLAIRLFLKHIDATITDSFCHANIGPLETKAGLIILDVMKDLQLPTPNLTLKYDETTSKKLAIQSIDTALATAKPSFANNRMFTEDFGGEYGIVSCYNGLKVGGGANTLVRLRLGKLAQEAETLEEFMETSLPHLVEKTLGYIDERSRFIIEESGFYETHFLVREGMLHREQFTGLLGIVGLAECTNTLMKIEGTDLRYGRDREADDLAMEIVKAISSMIDNHRSEYAGTYFDNKHLFHSQVGIETDKNESPGCRIPVGEEPEMFEHVVQSAPFHKYFPSGIGDIFVFDKTYENNKESILDIIEGAFGAGMRFYSLYGSDCDVVRVTGYLVKRSEIEKLERGEAVLRDTTVLGKGAADHSGALARKLRQTSEK